MGSNKEGVDNSDKVLKLEEVIRCKHGGYAKIERVENRLRREMGRFRRHIFPVFFKNQFACL